MIFVSIKGIVIFAAQFMKNVSWEGTDVPSFYIKKWIKTG